MHVAILSLRVTLINAHHKYGAKGVNNKGQFRPAYHRYQWQLVSCKGETMADERQTASGSDLGKDPVFLVMVSGQIESAEVSSVTACTKLY